MTMRYLALASLLGLALAPEADAKCAFVGLVPTVLAGGGDVAIAKDGGILVGATNSRDGKLDPGDAAVVATWRWRGAKAAPVIETLAPGLAVYRAAGQKTLELEDAARKVVGKAHLAAADEPKLAAPKVKQVTATGSRGYHGSIRVAVEVDAVPAGAVALIASDAKGVARSWGKVEAGKAITVFSQTWCGAQANGTVESKPGDAITLTWVDASGRKSPASAPIVVGGTITNEDRG